ncbi:molecular chaperone DnaJ [Luteitalea sp. TBR-22]|uniref:DnaJ C-terminal domain-containing protein n=1 Tax=Luteitalea sp. TBR-22 TaxID=2802971 RepID=UPI001AFACF4C|nr:J domain-containing protein [Luteitalea sp. TBR-22]BCS33574.1 molecular chaperone DnaJ [Luteitalea sp. TBR-22]
MDFRDYYATLGVAKTASEKEIKQAFRRLARKHHPDVNPGNSAAEAKFKEINEAYEVLGDAEKRRKYDELGANWKAYEQAQRQGFDPRGGGPFGGGGWPFGGAPGAQAGAQGGGYRSVSPEEFQEMFGEGANPFSDFFTTFFGGAQAGGARPKARGRRHHVPQEHDVAISLEEAFMGTTRKVTLTGAGSDRSLEVRFPAGIRDGQKVRAASDGGDVFFRVRLAPHPRFEPRGDHDLATRVAVPIPVAVIGGEIEVMPLVGPRVRAKVPAGTRPGAVLRLRGHGRPILGQAGQRGDLLVTLDLQVPTDLTPEERRHYEALAELRKVQPV